MATVTRPALVLGATGMIGQGIIRALKARDIDVAGTTRNLPVPAAAAPGRYVPFEFGRDSLSDLMSGYGPGDTVVNCLGVIKQRIDEASVESRRAAIAMNAELPHLVAALSEEQGFRVLHVTTDCVFSGSRGGYSETDVHDATDLYGRTKSLGEVPAPTVANLRCSVVGEEVRGGRSLLTWVLSHEPGSSFPGFVDHRWNGVTAPALGRIVAGAIAEHGDLTGTIHILPEGTVNKAALAQLMLDAYGRSDVTVVPSESGASVDRTLATLDPQRNKRLWADAGYASVQSIGQLVADLPHPWAKDGTSA